MALARTDKLSIQKPPIQKSFSDFLEKEFIKEKRFEKIPDTLIFEIGTAIEKAGRRKNALEYYEMVAKRFNGDTAKKRVCAERWILAKELQAKYVGNKMAEECAKEAAEWRKKYGIEGKIDEFIELDGKSSVIKYIIESEKKKEPENKETDKIKSPHVVVETPHKSHDVGSIRKKVEFSIEGYRLAYFAEVRKLNIESNTDGKTIQLCHSDQEKDCVSSRDYVVTNSFVKELGNCQKVEETPVYFCIAEDKIAVSFENTSIVINFF
jgi:hypothetical protein